METQAHTAAVAAARPSPTARAFLHSCSGRWIRAARLPHMQLSNEADAEKMKNAKYADKPPGFGFTTIAQGTQGELGREADAFLLCLAHEAACKQSGSDTPPPRLQAAMHWSFLQKLGITLMRMQAWQIVDYVLTDFHTTVARGATAHLLWSM